MERGSGVRTARVARVGLAAAAFIGVLSVGVAPEADANPRTAHKDRKYDVCPDGFVPFSDKLGLLACVETVSHFETGFCDGPFGDPGNVECNTGTGGGSGGGSCPLGYVWVAGECLPEEVIVIDGDPPRCPPGWVISQLGHCVPPDYSGGSEGSGGSGGTGNDCGLIGGCQGGGGGGNTTNCSPTYCAGKELLCRERASLNEEGCNSRFQRMSDARCSAFRIFRSGRGFNAGDRCPSHDLCGWPVPGSVPGVEHTHVPCEERCAASWMEGTSGGVCENLEFPGGLSVSIGVGAFAVAIESQGGPSVLSEVRAAGAYSSYSDYCEVKWQEDRNDCVEETDACLQKQEVKCP